MNIIVACEESQTVCKAFRARGHKAYSFDLLPCSGGHPEWHIQADNDMHIKDILYDKRRKWDMLIGHPPCTRLANSVIWYIKKHGLWQEVYEAAVFFNMIEKAPIAKKCIENPIQHGYVRNTNDYNSELIRKPDQIIQPYNFNEDASKATCLWLTGLPPLKHTGYYQPRIVNGKKRWGNQTDGGWNKLPPSADRARLRSVTYRGIAEAMASQWG